MNSLPNNSGKIWLFRRFLIGGTLFHSASYRRVVARNDYTVEFEMNGVKNFGTIQVYVKVEDKCFRVRCRDGQKCFCELACSYFALIETLVEDDQQLPRFRNNVVVNHIRKVNPSNRYTAYNRVRLHRSFLERLLWLVPIPTPNPMPTLPLPLVFNVKRTWNCGQSKTGTPMK